MTTLIQPPPDVDASAVAQLDTDAQRAPVPTARIVREGGPTAIRFDSRADFGAWADYGLIHVDANPYHTTVGHVEVHVPVTFGFPYSWNAVAIFPAQDPCPCEAEVVHQTGCPSDRYAHFGDVLTVDPDLTDGNDAAISHLLDAAAAIPVLVLTIDPFAEPTYDGPTLAEVAE